jgi:hypothetical protein
MARIPVHRTVKCGPSINYGLSSQRNIFMEIIMANILVLFSSSTKITET